MINSYFATIGSKLDEQFPANTINSTFQYETLENVPPMTNFKMITLDQLDDEIQNIAVHKSSGIHNMSSYVVKMCFTILNEYLLVIMNKSLFQGYFPLGWRRATVVPIPKVPIPKEIGDLRPIALTPLPGKLIERFVHTQIMLHLDNNQILNNIQNGFRKNHSTTDTIFKFTTELQNNKNSKLNTIALYIDFKKAFDTVNHNILLDKLYNLKITNTVLHWIKSYLTNRTQITQLNGQFSSNEFVTTGVPQGSILGPMLFLCYINDISYVCRNTKMLLYADDTVMYTTISDNEHFLDMHSFKQDVGRMYEWCQKNRLSINVKKTKAVFYPYSTTIANNVNQEIKINNQIIHYVNSYLYLGVDIDEHLTFKKYFSTLFQNVSHKLYLLRKVRPMLNEKAAIDIVKTMLCSIIDYGNMFISTCTAQNLSDLQNHALRCCYHVADPREEHIPDLHVSANIQMLDVRRKKQQTLCIWRNIQTGFIETYAPIRFTRSGIGKTVRLPIPRTEQYKKSVFYIGSKIWNDLKEDVRNLDNIKEFKKEIVSLF